MFSVETKDCKLHMIFGNKGSGKSTILTKLALSALRRGQAVYSTLRIPGTFLFDGKDFGKFSFPEGSLILLDEIGLLFDPRDFKTLRKDTIEMFKLQRHYKLTVYCFSQTWDDADKKIRDLTDDLWFSSKVLGRLNILKHITKKYVFPEKDSPKYGEIIQGYFLDFFLAPRSRIFTWMPFYWKFFNSFYVPDLPQNPKGSVYLLPVPGIPGYKKYNAGGDESGL